MQDPRSAGEIGDQQGVGDLVDLTTASPFQDAANGADQPYARQPPREPLPVSTAAAATTTTATTTTTTTTSRSSDRRRRHNPDLLSRKQVLRIPASSVAAVTGLHNYGDRLVDTFLDHVYQDMFTEFALDCRECGLQVVSQEEHIHSLIDKIGGDDAAVLKSARVDANDGKKVATTSDAAALQTKVKKAMTSRAAKNNLAAEDRKLLQRELRQQINTSFGNRNEDIAITEYERRTGKKVEAKNDALYVLSFPAPTRFWSRVVAADSAITPVSEWDLGEALILKATDLQEKPQGAKSENVCVSGSTADDEGASAPLDHQSDDEHHQAVADMSPSKRITPDTFSDVEVDFECVDHEFESAAAETAALVAIEGEGVSTRGGQGKTTSGDDDATVILLSDDEGDKNGVKGDDARFEEARKRLLQFWQRRTVSSEADDLGLRTSVDPGATPGPNLSCSRTEIDLSGAILPVPPNPVFTCTGCDGDGSGCCVLVGANLSRFQRRRLHQLAEDLGLGHATVHEAASRSTDGQQAMWAWVTGSGMQSSSAASNDEVSSVPSDSGPAVRNSCSFLHNILENVGATSLRRSWTRDGRRGGGGAVADSRRRGSTKRKRRQQKASSPHCFDVGADSWFDGPSDTKRCSERSTGRGLQPTRRRLRPFFKICGMIDGLTSEPYDDGGDEGEEGLAKHLKEEGNLPNLITTEQRERARFNRFRALERKKKKLEELRRIAPDIRHFFSAPKGDAVAAAAAAAAGPQLARQPKTAGNVATPQRRSATVPPTIYPGVFHALSMQCLIRASASAQPESATVVVAEASSEREPDVTQPGRHVVVEIKNRMHAIMKPPPLYDQIQSVVYMLMLRCTQADLVQFLKTSSGPEGRRDGRSQRRKRKGAKLFSRAPAASSSATTSPDFYLSIARIRLHGGPYFHAQNWDREVVPRLYQYVATVMKYRRHRYLRLAFLGSAEDAQRSALYHECPFLQC